MESDHANSSVRHGKPAGVPQPHPRAAYFSGLRSGFTLSSRLRAASTVSGWKLSGFGAFPCSAKPDSFVLVD